LEGEGGRKGLRNRTMDTLDVAGPVGVMVYGFIFVAVMGLVFIVARYLARSRRSSRQVKEQMQKLEQELEQIQREAESRKGRDKQGGSG